MNDRIVAWPYADLQNPFSVDEGGSFADYILHDPESMPELSLGSHVLVQDQRTGESLWLDATVVGIRAVSPFNPQRQNLLYIEDDETNPHNILQEIHGPHTLQRYLIRLRLNSELRMVAEDENRHYLVSAVQRPPSAVSSAVFPHLLPQEGLEEPSLSDMLRIKESGIELGAVGFGNRPYQENEQFLIYKLDIDNLDNKHMFIVGESGSGKTVLLKQLAWRLRQQYTESRVIITDVQGDIAQLLLPDIVTAPEPRGWQQQIQQIALTEAIEQMKPFTLVIPAAKEQETMDTVRGLDVLARNRGVQIQEIGLRIQDISRPSDVEYLYRVSSEQVAMLLDEEAEHIRANNELVTLQSLRRNINTQINRATGTQFTSNGGTSYYTSTGYAAFRALRSLGDYFDFHQPSMTSPASPLECLNTDGTIIIFLEHLSGEERLMWEMQLVQWLYDNKRLPQQYYVFIDEAHQIVPANPQIVGSRGTFDRLRSNFDKLSREGRKFGINLILSTQNPADLHPIVPDQCPSKIVMKIDPKNAKNAFLDSESASIAAQFGHGQFWFRNPFNNSPNWVRVHSWAPPLPHEPMTEFWERVRAQAQAELN